MALPGISNVPYIRKVFFFTHGVGLFAGLLFPVITAPILGEQVKVIPFFLICLLMGYCTGACMYFFVRITLKKQLRQQLQLLQPLTGKSSSDDDSVEALNHTVKVSVSQVEMLVETIIETIEELAPHYVALSERSNYLSERVNEGLKSATKNREIVVSMEEQHRNIAEQMEILSNRTQEEAAISRELFASLQEMASAMEHSNMKFLETTSSVDEMASSTRQVSEQASDFGRLVEGSVGDLQGIEKALVDIQQGASTSAESVIAVTRNAESGIEIMNESISEMDRIDEESNKAISAMQRLVQQTDEVTNIIEVIKDLVSDTELLAFNAAIIAAKAGAEGKGFSVVAGEIRDLADRTTTSAEDIHRIITAIANDTVEVTDAVNATAARISRGKQLSMETGAALAKILESAKDSNLRANEISKQTSEQSTRAHTLIDDTAKSLMSVKSIVNAMNEQTVSIHQVQEGTAEMKLAADQISRGMEEQVKANREFDHGLAEREEMIHAVNSAVKFQSETVQKIYGLIENSQNRLRKNEDKLAEIVVNIEGMEILSGRLKELADVFRMNKGETLGDE
jgi:methyl-accepting chemotaxis protein